MYIGTATRRHPQATTPPPKPCASACPELVEGPIAATRDMRCQSRTAFLHQDGHPRAPRAPSWSLRERSSAVQTVLAAAGDLGYSVRGGDGAVRTSAGGSIGIAGTA